MADKDDKPAARPLEDLEAEIDRMEDAEAGGEASRPFAALDDDDVEVVLAAEDDDGKPVGLERPAEETPAEEGEIAHAGEHGEDEDASYSEKVRRRINRERTLRVSAEDREEAERTARIAAQTEAHSSKLSAAEITLSMVEGQIKDKEGSLKVAKDGGKIDDDIRLTGELSDLRRQRAEVEQVRDHLKNSKPAQPNPLVHQWQRENRWFNNAEFAAESAAVRTISAQIATKFPPTSKEHFDEINKELQKRMPNLAARVKARLGQDAIRWEGDRRPNGNGSEPAAAATPKRQAPRLASPGPGFGRAQAGSKRQIVLTRADIDGMRAVRLDPSNKTHVLEYAREKEAIARSQR